MEKRLKTLGEMEAALRKNGFTHRSGWWWKVSFPKETVVVPWMMELHGQMLDLQKDFFGGKPGWEENGSGQQWPEFLFIEKGET